MMNSPARNADGLSKEQLEMLAFPYNVPFVFVLSAMIGLLARRLGEDVPLLVYHHFAGRNNQTSTEDGSSIQLMGAFVLIMSSYCSLIYLVHRYGLWEVLDEEVVNDALDAAHHRAREETGSQRDRAIERCQTSIEELHAQGGTKGEDSEDKTGEIGTGTGKLREPKGAEEVTAEVPDTFRKLRDAEVADDGVTDNTNDTTTTKLEPKSEEKIEAICKEFFDKDSSPNYEENMMICVAGDARAAAIRALTARDFDLEESRKLIKETLEWRRKRDVNSILQQPIPRQKVNCMREALNDGFRGTDNEGYLLYFNMAGKLDLQSMVDKVGYDTLEHYHIQVLEFLQQVVYPELSWKVGFTVYQITQVLDLKGFGFSTFRRSISVIKQLTALDGDRYYESVHKVLIVNASGAFQLCMKSVLESNLVNPATKRKFIVLSEERELLNYIPAPYLPTKYGGTYEGSDCFSSPENPVTRFHKHFDSFVAQQAEKQKKMKMKEKAKKGKE